MPDMCHGKNSCAQIFLGTQRAVSAPSSPRKSVGNQRFNWQCLNGNTGWSGCLIFKPPGFLFTLEEHGMQQFSRPKNCRTSCVSSFDLVRWPAESFEQAAWDDRFGSDIDTRGLMQHIVGQRDSPVGDRKSPAQKFRRHLICIRSGAFLKQG